MFSPEHLIIALSNNTIQNARHIAEEAHFRKFNDVVILPRCYFVEGSSEMYQDVLQNATRFSVI